MELRSQPAPELTTSPLSLPSLYLTDADDFALGVWEGDHAAFPSPYQSPLRERSKNGSTPFLESFILQQPRQSVAGKRKGLTPYSLPPPFAVQRCDSTPDYTSLSGNVSGAGVGGGANGGMGAGVVTAPSAASCMLQCVAENQAKRRRLQMVSAPDVSYGFAQHDVGY